MRSEGSKILSNIVIGAGPAGLAVMKELKSCGLPFLGLESHEEIGGLWNIRNPQSPAYLELTTNSSKSTTYLDQKAPLNWPSYLTHEKALRYLHDFAERHELKSQIRFCSEVTKITKAETDNWRVLFLDRRTGQKHTITSHTIAICTGVHTTRNKYIPKSLLDKFKGSEIDFIHSSHYADSAAYAGKRVLVVGFGNSAADIVTVVSAVAERTVLSARSVPWIIPLWVLGLPADRFRGYSNTLKIPFPIQNFVFHCLQRAYIGHPRNLGLGPIRHDLLDRLPVLDRGLRKAIRRSQIHLCGPSDRVEGRTVFFAREGDRFEDVDNIIFATGYERNYPFLEEEFLQPVLKDNSAFPFLIFHPTQKNLFFTSEVTVPQGSWPLFAKQAKAIVSYLEAENRPGKNFYRFNETRQREDPDFKGRIFCCEDRFHVDPNVYARHIDRFCDWIRL